jgi:large subunit ribosomal protein L22
MASIGTLATRVRHLTLSSTFRWSAQCRAKPSMIAYDPMSTLASVTSGKNGGNSGNCPSRFVTQCVATWSYAPGFVSTKIPAARTFSTNPEMMSAEGSTAATEEHSDIPSDLVSVELMDLVLKSPKKKLRPRVVRKRIEKLRIYEGKEKGIRGSPWKLNLVCQFAAGQTVPEALTQLMFVEKAKAPLVAKVIKRTCNLASIRDGLLPCQIEVAECFSTHGTPLKRVRYHSKGR